MNITHEQKEAALNSVIGRVTEAADTILAVNLEKQFFDRQIDPFSAMVAMFFIASEYAEIVETLPGMTKTSAEIIGDAFQVAQAMRADLDKQEAEEQKVPA